MIEIEIEYILYLKIDSLYGESVANKNNYKKINLMFFFIYIVCFINLIKYYLN